MGDRTHTSIEFSGIISFEQAEELRQLLEDQGCYSNTDGDTPTVDHLVACEGFYDSECNYGMMEDIESWCKDNAVSYCKQWEAGGDYGPGTEIYDVTTGKTMQQGTLDSSPAITLEQLVEARDAGTIDTLIEGLRVFNFTTDKFPPLRVLKVEDWTPELCVRMAERALLDD